jgi:hypothetical protein
MQNAGLGAAAPASLQTAEDYGRFVRRCSPEDCSAPMLDEMWMGRSPCRRRASSAPGLVPAERSIEVSGGLGWGIDTITGTSVWHWGDNDIFPQLRLSPGRQEKSALVFFYQQRERPEPAERLIRPTWPAATILIGTS